MEADNQLLLVNQLVREEKPIKVKPISGLVEYDNEFYKKQYNHHSAEQFLRYVAELEKLVKDKKWNLEKKFNKNYCGFKAGFFNAFGVHWMGSKTFAFFLKIAEKDIKNISPPFTRYDVQWKQAYYYIDPGSTKTKDFIPHFELAYKRLTGD